MHAIWLIVGAFSLLGLFLLFPTTRARALGASLLLPLVALAWAVISAGERPREESDIVQSAPTPETLPSSHSGSASATSKESPSATASGSSHPDIGLTLHKTKTLDAVTWPDPGTEYTSNTLWNRIDGGAEAYTKAGMRRAYFATARIDDVDIEVQVFDFVSTPKADRFFEAMDRSPDSVAFTAGDKAVLWTGGGEVQRGRYYARVVLSTAAPSAAAELAVKEILRTVGVTQSAKTHPVEKTSPSVAVVAAPEEKPAPALPSAQTGADDSAEPFYKPLNISRDIADLYGLQSVKRVKQSERTVYLISAKTAWHAAAYARSLLSPADGKTTSFQGTVDGTYVKAHGNLVAQGATKSLVLAVLATRTEQPILGLEALKPQVQSLEIQLGGWNGVRSLGPTLFGTLEDDTDIFIAAPPSQGDAWAALLQKHNMSPTDETEVVFEDDYQGSVILVRGKKAIIGMIGYEDRASAKKRIDELLADI